MKSTLLEQKVYEVKTPKTIIFGDPMYFEDFEDDPKRLKSLIAELKLTKNQIAQFVSRVVIKNERFEDEGFEFDSISMNIYIAPSEHIGTYMNDQYYKVQKETTKDIGVDSACYLLQVDDNYDEFRTGADGYWGCHTTYSRTINGKKHVDAHIVSITMTEDLSMEDVEQYLKYFFKDTKEIEN